MDEITPGETPLKVALREAKLSQAALAKAVGIDQSQVSYYCRGVHPTKNETRVSIAETLRRHGQDVTVQSLWPELRAGGRAA